MINSERKSACNVFSIESDRFIEPNTGLLGAGGQKEIIIKAD